MPANPLQTLTGPRVIVALDYADGRDALAFVDQLDPGLCRLKVGHELFTAAGPQLIEHLVSRGYDVFLDLKYHDIPTTVAKACRQAAGLGVWMVNVHALGGGAMMHAACEALGAERPRPLLIAVTLLTSQGEEELRETGLDPNPLDNVLRLANLAQASGLDGVVCSAQEAQPLRKAFGPQLRLVTPGIRPSGRGANDQKRVVPPAEAIANGADWLVIGRPITLAADPVAALQDIRREIGED